MKSYNLEDFKKFTSQEGFSDYKRLLGKLLDVLDAERGCLWFEGSDELIYRGDESLRDTFPFSRSIFERVLEHGNGFVTFDPASDDRIGPMSSVAMHNVRSALAAAAQDEDEKVFMVAYFDNRMTAPPFSKEDLRFLQDVMDSLPGAVPNPSPPQESQSSNQA
jgi:GAF domain-containing protein